MDYVIIGLLFLILFFVSLAAFAALAIYDELHKQRLREIENEIHRPRSPEVRALADEMRHAADERAHRFGAEPR